MDLDPLRYGRTPNHALLALVGPDVRTVLDVGCGVGGNAASLAARGAIVDGITASPLEAEQARAHMRECWVADLERGLPEAAHARRYDVVLMSHVLEHLRAPERLVAEAAEVLVDGGVMLVAVPNVLNWRTRLDLARGRWQYTDLGVLDRTHLRFYTFESAKALFADAPELELEVHAPDGIVPLGVLRRHGLPRAVKGRVDALGRRLWPGLVAAQTLMRAKKRVLRDVAADAPRVSACLLTYEHAHVLRETVATILAQDMRDFELIISDDCSRDGTYELACALAAEDARVRVVRTPENRGMAGNANFAVALARAPFVALLHHDDLYAPTLFSRWLEVMARDAKMGFVSNAYANHGSDVRHVSTFPEVSDGAAMLDELLSRWDCPFRGTALIRRAAWDAVGGMRERFGLLADVDLWMRLAARGPVGYVRDTLITVRQDRPDGYPDDYVRWSWRRLRLLYEIHAANLARRHAHGLDAQLAHAGLRARVSADTAKWLAYAVAKRRWDMLATSAEVANALELPALVALREGLARLAVRAGRAG